MLPRIAIVGLLIMIPSLSARATMFTISSDPADGQIVHQGHGSGGFLAPETGSTSMFVGGVGSPGELRTAILFFELPAPGTVQSANLSVYINRNDPQNSTQRADLWGLGYQPTPSILNAWSLEANSDPNAIGGGVGIADRVKIQDNFFTINSASTSGNIVLDPPVNVVTSTTGNANLLAYIQSLYDDGASEGDFAVMRINYDVDISSNRRWQMLSGDHTTPSEVPILQLDILYPPAPPEAIAVPEPSSLFVWGILGLAIGLVRRKRKCPNT